MEQNHQKNRAALYPITNPESYHIIHWNALFGKSVHPVISLKGNLNTNKVSRVGNSNINMREFSKVLVSP